MTNRINTCSSQFCKSMNSSSYLHIQLNIYIWISLEDYSNKRQPSMSTSTPFPPMLIWCPRQIHSLLLQTNRQVQHTFLGQILLNNMISRKKNASRLDFKSNKVSSTSLAIHQHILQDCSSIVMWHNFESEQPSNGAQRLYVYTIHGEQTA